MVWNNDQRLLAQTQSLALHCCGNAAERFTAANRMCSQTVTAIKNVGNHIFLVWPQRDLGIHAGESQVASIVFSGTDAVKPLVVARYQHFTPLWIAEYPVTECVLDGILFLLGKNRLLLIHHSLFVAVQIVDHIIDLGAALIQRIFQQSVGRRTICTIGNAGNRIAGI